MSAEPKRTVQEALSEVMGDVQAVGKHQRVDSGPAKYAFRGVDAVVNAVGPALRAHGVVVLPEVLAATFREYQSRNGGQMQEAQVTMRYTFVGPDGSQLACSALGQSSDSSDKAAAKAQSVAYRVALLQALCIPTDEPDPDESREERATPPAAPKFPAAQAKRDLRQMFVDARLPAAEASEAAAAVWQAGPCPDASKGDEVSDDQWAALESAAREVIEAREAA